MIAQAKRDFRGNIDLKAKYEVLAEEVTKLGIAFPIYNVADKVRIEKIKKKLKLPEDLIDMEALNNIETTQTGQSAAGDTESKKSTQQINDALEKEIGNTCKQNFRDLPDVVPLVLNSTPTNKEVGGSQQLNLEQDAAMKDTETEDENGLVGIKKPKLQEEYRRNSQANISSIPEDQRQKQ